MDTEARERALLRRIEELAEAAADDQQAGDGSIVAAALGDVRAALGALRGDVGNLRSDVVAARSGVDSNGNRLAAALSDARVDTEELARRHDHLAGRVDDLFDAVGEMRSMLTELRNAVVDQPSGIAGVTSAVARVDENLGAKVDTLADDLRRTLNAGLTQATAGTRASETALAETRSVLEERLAAVEDTLDGLAERLEAIARDSITSNEDHLGRIERKVDELTATALPEAVEAQEQWAHEIRGALGDLGSAVDRSLGSLGDSLTDAVRSTREDERAHMEELVAQLDRRIGLTRDAAAASTAELRGFLEAFQEATQGRLEEVRAALASGLATARDELLSRLQSSLDGIESANGESRRLVEDEVAALRTDLADALEEVRDRIAATVSVAQIGIVNAVEDQRASFDEVVRTLRADVLDRVEESTATVRAGLDDLRAGVTTAARAGEESTRRIGDFAGTLEQVDAAVTEMHTDWDRRTDAAIDLVAQAGHAAVDEFRDEVHQVLEDLRRSVDTSASSVDESVDLVGTATARLVSAGQALLGYLARRDQVLEQERDRTLHEVLDEFAQGLSAKERRGLADRVGEAIDRRRDARDAERFRRTTAGEAVPEPPEIPADLTALAEPVRPPRSQVAEALPPAGRVTPARTRAAKKSGTTKPVAKRVPAWMAMEPDEPTDDSDPTTVEGASGAETAGDDAGAAAAGTTAKAPRVTPAKAAKTTKATKTAKAAKKAPRKTAAKASGSTRGKAAAKQAAVAEPLEPAEVPDPAADEALPVEATGSETAGTETNGSEPAGSEAAPVKRATSRAARTSAPARKATRKSTTARKAAPRRTAAAASSSSAASGAAPDGGGTDAAPEAAAQDATDPDVRDGATTLPDVADDDVTAAAGNEPQSSENAAQPASPDAESDDFGTESGSSTTEPLDETGTTRV